MPITQSAPGDSYLLYFECTLTNAGADWAVVKMFLLSLLRASIRWERSGSPVRCWNLGAAILLVAAGALAEFSKANVTVLAQFQAGGNHHAVNIDAGLPLKLEQHIHGACIVCSAAENPAATTQDSAGEGLDQARGLFCGDGLHLHGPGNVDCMSCILGWQHEFHTCFIGAGKHSIIVVAESNGSCPALRHLCARRGPSA